GPPRSRGAAGGGSATDPRSTADGDDSRTAVRPGEGRPAGDLRRGCLPRPPRGRRPDRGAPGPRETRHLGRLESPFPDEPGGRPSHRGRGNEGAQRDRPAGRSLAKDGPTTSPRSFRPPSGTLLGPRDDRRGSHAGGSSAPDRSTAGPSRAATPSRNRRSDASNALTEFPSISISPTTWPSWRIGTTISARVSRKQAR